MTGKIKNKLLSIHMTSVMTVMNTGLMVFTFYPLLYLLFFEDRPLLSSYVKAGLIILALTTLIHQYFKLPEPGLVCLLPFCIFYLLGIVLGKSLLYRTMFFLLAADLIVIFTYVYFHGFEQFLANNDSISDMPVSYMKKVQRLFFVIALLLVVAVMIPTFTVNTDPLAEYFEEANEKGKKATVSEAVQEERWAEEANFEVGETEYAQYFDELIHIPQWLLNIVDFAFMILVFAFILYLIYQFIKSVIATIMEYEKFETDEIIYLDRAEDAMMQYSSDQKEKFLDTVLKSHRSVRRRFKNAIKRGTKGKVNASCSPEELEIQAGYADDPRMQTLHKEYESVRYGRS